MTTVWRAMCGIHTGTGAFSDLPKRIGRGKKGSKNINEPEGATDERQVPMF